MPWRSAPSKSQRMRSTDAAPAAIHAARSARPTSLTLREAHLRRGALGRGLELEVLALREAEGPREQVAREGLDRGVEVAHDRVVVAARVLDRVLDAGQLALEPEEVLVRAQLGVRLGDREQRLQHP